MGGPRDIHTNPATRRRLQGVCGLRPEELQSRDAAEETLKASGFVPLSKRNLGSLKLGLFYLANIIPFVGQFGAWCANRQAMGSQKAEDRHSLLRDFGQTYLNATVGRELSDYRYSKDRASPVKTTFTGEKTLRKLTKFWSETVGSGFHLFGMTGDEESMTDHQRRLKRAFRDNFTNQFGRYPSPELTKSINVGRLMELSGQRAREDKENVYKEYQEIDRRQAVQQALAEFNLKSLDSVRYEDGFKHAVEMRLGSAVLTYEGIKNRSENLKAYFAKYLADEDDIQDLYLKEWADRSLCKAGIQIEGPDERYRILVSEESRYKLSKHDMLAGFENFIEAGSRNQVGLDRRDKKEWEYLYNKHLNDYRRRLQEAEKAYKQAKALCASTPAFSKDLKGRLKKRSELDRKLREIKSEKFDWDGSREFGIALSRLFDAAETSLDDCANRFGQKLHDRTLDSGRR